MRKFRASRSVLSCILAFVAGCASAHGTHIPQPCDAGGYTHLSGGKISWEGSEGHIFIDSIPITDQRFEFVLSFDVLLDERHADLLSHLMLDVSCTQFNMWRGPVELLWQDPSGTDFRFAGICTGERLTHEEMCGEEVHG